MCAHYVGTNNEGTVWLWRQIMWAQGTWASGLQAQQSPETRRVTAGLHVVANAAFSVKRLVEVLILVFASTKNAEELPIVPALRAHYSVRRFAGRCVNMAAVVWVCLSLRV